MQVETEQITKHIITIPRDILFAGDILKHTVERSRDIDVMKAYLFTGLMRLKRDTTPYPIMS